MLGERCYSHNVDEPRDTNTYRVCFECNHVYQTEADLLAAHNRNKAEMGDGPEQQLTPSLASFCAECIHDF